MTWDKREPVQNMVFLGDGEGQSKKVGGLLVDIQKNRKYPDKDDYYIVKQSGEEVVLGGNATLSRQISRDDIGRFVKCEFKGWDKGANGKFKVIEVFVWRGEATPEMKVWPRFQEFQRPVAPAPAPSSNTHAQPAAGAEAEDLIDDDLPF